MRERRIEGFLSESEIQKIHEASIEILAEVGVKVGHPLVRQLLLDAGAKEGSNSVLIFPPSLIEGSLKKTPHSIRFEDLAGTTVEVEPGAPPLFWTGTALFYVRGSERKE